MKKLVYSMALMLALGGGSAMAQEKKCDCCKGEKMDKTEMSQRRTEQMTERYGLDEKQSKKLLELNKEYGDKMRPMGRPPRMRPNDNPSKEQMQGEQAQERPNKEQFEEMRKKMEEEREAYNKELKKIMTDEQYAKYEQDEKNMKQPRGRFGGNKKDE